MKAFPTTGLKNIPYISLTIGLLAGIILSGFSAISQSNYTPFSGEDINGKQVRFPDCLREKKTLVGFAFSQRSQEALESWIEPVYYELMDTTSLASLVYDANVYLLVVFNEATSKFKGRMIREMKENLPVDFYDNIVLTESNASDIKRDFNIKNNDVLTLVTFDKEGNPTSREEGFYSERKFDKLSAHLEIDYEGTE